MKKYLSKYMYENSKEILVLFTISMLGILIGIIGYNFLNDNVQNELKESIVSLLQMSKSEKFRGINIIKNGVRNNLLLILFIYLGSFTFFNKQLNYFINISRGMVVGLLAQIFLNICNSPTNILIIILYIILPNLIYIPSCIYLSINSNKLNYHLINNKKDIYMLFTEIIKIACIFSLMFLSLFIEQIALILMLKIC